jgi:hypothetical protein
VQKIFWGYHFLVLLLVLIEGPLGFSRLGLAKPAGLILIPFWAAYAFNVVAVYLPINGLYSLYSYLKQNNIPPSHAILISIFAVVGVISTLAYISLHRL